MGLQEILQLAVKNDAQLQADTFSASAYRADGWSGVAGYGPTLTVTGAITRSRDSSTPTHIPETLNGQNPEERSVNFFEPVLHIGFEQPLVDLQKAYQLKTGRTVIRAADFRKRKALEELRLKVHQFYYTILTDREKLNLARQESTALLQQVRMIREKLKLGSGIISDQYDAESRYRLSRAAEIDRENNLADSRRALEESINIRLCEPLDNLEAEVSLPVPSRKLNYWRLFGHKNNTDILLRQFEAEIAGANHHAARSRFLPSLVFFADYNERHPENGLSGYGEKRIETDMGIRLKMELLSGGRDSAALAATGARLRAAEKKLVAARRRFDRSLDSLWRGLETKRKLIATYKSAVQSSKHSLESNRAAYDQGGKVLLDVLNSQRDYFKTLTRYRSSRYEYMVLYEKFKILTGAVNQFPSTP
jgi:outer membrane protein TolC